MKDTITVQRANVVLDISPEQKEYYLGQGYSVIDSSGKIIEGSTVPTIEGLNAQIQKLKAEIAEKDAEIATLKSNQRGRKKNEE